MTRQIQSDSLYILLGMVSQDHLGDHPDDARPPPVQSPARSVFGGKMGWLNHVQ